MATSNMTATAMSAINAALPFSAWTRVPWAGSVETTLVKINNDMPLPIPRWVMSSPIHINRAVPLVSVSTTTNTVHALNFGSRSTSPTSPPLWNRNANEVDCTTAIEIVR